MMTLSPASCAAAHAATASLAATRDAIDAPGCTRDQPPRRSRLDRIAEDLQLIEQHVPMQRRVLHAGRAVYQAGDPFTSLHLVHSGIFKHVNLAVDGREQVVALHFKGDLLGLDGIASGQHACDAVAMDTGEVWSFRYEALLRACTGCPSLLGVLHSAMSREIGRDCDSLMALCTLPADARVADFLRYWAESLSSRGMRTDQITLRMTRAEIGNHLGMTLESVSRAMSRLARLGLIGFAEKGRREMQIPDVAGLVRFIQQSVMPTPARLQ